MARGTMMTWEALLARALRVIDSVPFALDWSFGGGTALMLRHRHRLSTDIDIFVAEPQLLGHLSPRLNPAAEELTSDYVEQGRFVKLYFPDGEIDFIASPPLTPDPVTRRVILGREIAVETPAEIIAKKVWHRAREFTARDLFDLALIAEREPEALEAAGDVLASRRRLLLRRLDEKEDELREDFAALQVLDYRPTYEACVRAVLDALAASGGRAPRMEQPRARYRVFEKTGSVPVFGF